MAKAEKRSFTVELRTEPLEVIDHAQALFDRLAEVLFADAAIAGPAVVFDDVLKVIEIRSSVDAENSIMAVMVVTNAVGRALKAAHITATLGRIEAWPDVEGIDWPDELVNGGEVARRLQISRERFRQLVSENRLPRPEAATERDRIWRWGDIATWARMNERRTKVPRRKRVSQGELEHRAVAARKTA